jgi:hypothetical protein
MTTSLETADAADGDDRCHLATPVRFGRRKTDQVGHLQLTTGWLRFRGTVDLSIPWPEVSRVDHAGRDVVVVLHGTRRTVLFCCLTDQDAFRAAVTAGHLAALAAADPVQPA